MKIWIFSFSLFFFSSVFGVYVGNPASPSVMNTGFFSAHNPLIKGTTGYIADYITDKLYEPAKGNSEFNPDDTFRKFMIHSQLASFSVIILERLEIFGTLGGSKPRAKLHEEPSNIYNFGYFYGITASLSGKFHLNFEQRFRDEKAYTFSTIAVF
jgi:hypothetical protein